MNTETQFSRTFEADEAIAKDLRVKLDADGKITIAALANEGIGTAYQEAFAAGAKITVYLDGPIRRAVAAAAITVGARLYTAAGGKVSSTAAAGGFPYAVALESASGDGSHFDVMLLGGAEANP